MKKILLYERYPNRHEQTKIMVNNSPEGYEFITLDKKPSLSLLQKLFQKNKISYKFKKISHYSDISLIFSPGIILDINFPYVVEILDHPACLAGYNYNLFMKNNKLIEKKLLSPWCKKIVIANDSSLDLMKKYFSNEVIKKCILLRAAILKQFYKKNYNKQNIQILFIGSLANPNDFYIKGGLEAIESFLKISHKFSNVKLVVRCKLPPRIKEKYFNKQINFLENRLSDKELEELFKSTDILLQPGHIYPLTATIESMSYGIPIIMLDTYGVRDYLNGKCAILINPAEKITQYKSKEYPLNVRSKKFISEIKLLDKRVILDLSHSLEKLIQNTSLRKKLGTKAKEISKSKFSIEQKNNILKKIFDEAIN